MNAGDALPVLRDLQSAVSELTGGLVIPWGLTHGDVRGPNVLYDGKSVGFTDLNPKVLPLLRDVVMIRNKWLMNGDTGERPLNPEEVASFLRGYTDHRSLTEAEQASFPVIWTVYQADRLLRDRRIMERADPTRRARWPIAEQISALPEELDAARELLDLSAQ